MTRPPCLVCGEAVTLDAPVLTHPSCTPTLGDELLAMIAWTSKNQPRNLQKRIGPSGIGHPCERWVGMTLAGFEPRRGDTDPAVDLVASAPWKPFVGTAVHALLAEQFERLQALLDDLGLGRRFHVEKKVSSGQVVGPETIDGTGDLYDDMTGTVIDWKITGDNMRRKYRREGPGWQYRTQVAEYGRGWVASGFAVRRVMIVFLPMAGDLRDSVVWSEDYSPSLAERAYRRIDALYPMVTHPDPEIRLTALTELRTADHYCGHCPFYTRDARDITEGCPGHFRAEARKTLIDDEDILTPLPTQAGPTLEGVVT